MSIATITSKGQVTLPKDVRDMLHLDSGEKVDFVVDKETGTATMIPLNKSVDEVCCVLAKYGKSKVVSVEEMDKAIASKMKERLK